MSIEAEVMKNLVTAGPGVSTTTICCSNLMSGCLEHVCVTDDPDNNEVSAFFPRIVFPVELLPDLVFPRSTILISSPTNFAEIITLRTRKTTIGNDVVKQ